MARRPGCFSRRNLCVALGLSKKRRGLAFDQIIAKSYQSGGLKRFAEFVHNAAPWFRRPAAVRPY